MTNQGSHLGGSDLQAIGRLPKVCRGSRVFLPKVHRLLVPETACGVFGRFKSDITTDKWYRGDPPYPPQALLQR